MSDYLTELLADAEVSTPICAGQKFADGDANGFAEGKGGTWCSGGEP
ncbi:hypothetical protein AAE485_10235 [Acidithiobacillus ferriphilus]